MPLSYTEDLLLLVLDDQTGKLRNLPDRAFEYALAGAVLAQFSEDDLVRVSPQLCEVVGTGKFPDDVLHQGLLLQLRKSTDTSLEGWLSLLAGEAEAIRENGLNKLVEKGILQKRDESFLWVFHTRRYPLLDNTEEEEVITRIRQRVLSPDLTSRDPSDLPLIALMDVCQLSYIIFSPDELETCNKRIHELARREVIGKTMTEIIQQIQRALLEIRSYSGL